MYLLTPPTESYKTGSHSLWGRISHTRGFALVVYTDGRVTALREAPSATEESVLWSWPGGRTYEITDEQAEVLIEAGYSANVEEVE